jgi:hypothetical protein
MSKFAALVIVASVGSFTAAGGYALIPREWHDPSCNIKGNISINSGKHIFHVRGQQDYDATVINHRYGERWFCSEADARRAGWQKASR